MNLRCLCGDCLAIWEKERDSRCCLCEDGRLNRLNDDSGLRACIKLAER